MSLGAFKVGGAVADEGSLYVHRPADDLLPAALLGGDYAYVLAPRQIGKSSLQARTQKKLLREGVACVTIDLEGFGLRDSTAANGYFDLLAEIAAQLDLPYPDAFWERHQLLTPVQRFLRYLREEVLPLPRPLVLFFDEVEEVFPHAPALRDDFFAAVRYLYNQRASDPAYRRLTVCLTGVASPLDLIRDAARTPFNIGQGIALNDFSRAEVAELTPGFSGMDADVDALLDKVHRWTGGQPYLTQKLCDALVSRGVRRGGESDAVQRTVAELFFRQGAFTVAEPHLAHAARYFERVSSDPRAARMLALYKRILYHGPIVADSKDAVQMDLRLTGLAVERPGLLAETQAEAVARVLAESRRGRRRSAQGGAPTQITVLAVRNPIYAQVFDEAWIRQREGLRPLTAPRERWELAGRSPRALPRGVAMRALLREVGDEGALTPEEREFLLAARLSDARTRFRARLVGIGGALTVVALSIGWWLQAQKQEALRQAAQAEVRAVLSQKREAQAEARRQQAELAREQEETLRYVEAKAKEEAELRERMAAAEKQAYGAKLLTEKLRGEEQAARLREEERGRAAAAARSRDLEEDAAAMQQRIIRLLSQVERGGRELATAQRQIAELESELMRARGQLARSLPAQRRPLAGLAAGLLAAAPLLRPGSHPAGTEALVALGEAAQALWTPGEDVPSDARGRLRRELRHPEAVYRVAFEPGGRWMLTMCDDGRVRRFALPSGRELPGVSGDATPAPFVAAAAPGGRFLLTRQGGPLGGDPRHLWLFDVRDGLREGAAPQVLDGHRAPVLMARFSPDGGLLATASEDRTARLWQHFGSDGREGYRPLAVLTGARGPVRAVTLGADGRVLAGAADGVVRAYDAAGRPIFSLGPFDSAERSGAPVSGGGRGVRALQLSRDGDRALAVYDDGAARVFDLRHRGILTALRGVSGGPLRAALLAADGQRAALLGQDGVVRVVDAGSGAERAQLGWAGRQQALALSEDGRLALAGADGAVRIVGLTTGALQLHLPAAGARELAFSPDGATLVGIGADPVVRLYPGSLRDFVSAACAVLRAACTPEDGCDLPGLTARGVCG